MSRVYTIELVAFTPITTTLFKTTITMMARRGFPVALHTTSNTTPSLYLVDSDNEVACNAWRKANPYPKATLVFIGKNNYGWMDVARLDKPLKWDLLTQAIMSSVKKPALPPPSGWLGEMPVTNHRVINPLAKYQKPKVLIVDDSLTIRRYISLKLHDYNVDIFEAPSAEEAFVLLDAIKFSLIFMDVMLPEMDGYEACRIIKKERMLDVPVIMTTSRDSPFDKMRGQIAGSSNYLVKPIDDTSFHQMMQQYFK